MIVIFGCGGHGRSVADVLLCNQRDSSQEKEDFYFVDDNARPGEKIFGRKVFKQAEEGQFQAILAIGDNAKRKAFYDNHPSFSYRNLVADDAYIGTETRIGEGNFIAHKAFVGPSCVIGTGNIINTGESLDHECRVGDFSHISVGATLAGKVTVGDRVFIGAGATVIDGVRIGSDIVIGAGATVTRDLLEPGTYVGTPAKKYEGKGKSTYAGTNEFIICAEIKAIGRFCVHCRKNGWITRSSAVRNYTAWREAVGWRSAIFFSRNIIRFGFVWRRAEIDIC